MRKRKSRQPQPEETFVAAIIPTEFHIVTRDDKPCTLINVSGLHKGGVLLPGSPVAAFSKPRDARRAVQRTVTAREKLRDSMLSDWKQLKPFLSGGRFDVVPAGHQVEPAALLAGAREPRQEALQA